MMTPQHYYRYAEKKRLKLVFISGIMIFFILFIFAPYLAYWKIAVPILLIVAASLYRIYNTELHLFLGLRETENLISLEENINGDNFAHTIGIYQHRKNLKNGSYNFYSLF